MDSGRLIKPSERDKSFIHRQCFASKRNIMMNRSHSEMMMITCRIMVRISFRASCGSSNNNHGSGERARAFCHVRSIRDGLSREISRFKVDTRPLPIQFECEYVNISDLFYLTDEANCSSKVYFAIKSCMISELRDFNLQPQSLACVLLLLFSTELDSRQSRLVSIWHLELWPKYYC